MTSDPTTDSTKSGIDTALASLRFNAEARRSAWRTAEVRWGWSRLATFLAGAGIWFFDAVSFKAAVAVTVALLALFVLSVRRHLRARDEREFADRLLTVIEEARSRAGGNLAIIRSVERPEDARIAVEPMRSMLGESPTWTLTEQEQCDLDIYSSPMGLFGILNRASTALGARRLRDACDNPSISPDTIADRQACVRWLHEHDDVRTSMMAAAAILRNKDDAVDGLVSAIQTARPMDHPVRAKLLRFWSIPSGLFVIVALVPIAMGKPGWLAAATAVALVNTVLYFQMHGELRRRVAPWVYASLPVRGLLSICGHGTRQLPTDTYLSRLRDAFDRAQSAEALPALRWRLEWTNTGGTIHALLNMLMFYDLHVADAVLSRVVPHRETLLDAISSLADLEVLNSLACFASEQPVTCYPEPSTAARLVVDGGVHPLIAPSHAVPNDVTLTDGIHVSLVTGSNMAGKSTYLRMVGINALLAQMGSAATARRMSFVPTRLITDLRITDSLDRAESYFLAEVRQLRRMLAPKVSDAPVLGLIDEPFRGTNSDERVAASMAVVQQLMTSRHFFIVATHERRLTELADDRRARNYHFHEDLEGDGAVFDYRLQPGPAHNRNALLILEREGYPAKLLEQAHAWLDGCTDSP